MQPASRLARVLAIVSCLVFAFASACGGGGGQECTVDVQCGPGRSCVNNTCVNSSACAVGVQSCTNSTQCPAGNDCESGCCTPLVTGCASAADCHAASAPYCDPTAHTCKPCSANSQCSPGRICSATSGTCESACAQNSDCKAPVPVCRTNTTGSFCAECASDLDCKAAGKPTCSPAGRCTGCASDKDCGGATPACNTATNVCVACVDASNANGVNAACTASGKAACENQVCVTCNPASSNPDTTNGACPAATPVCSKASACITCDKTANATGTGKNPACPAATPVCDSNTACVGCLADSQCAAGSYCDPAAKACATPALAAFPDVTVGSGQTTSLQFTLTHAVVAPAGADVAVALAPGDPGTLAAATVHLAQGASSGSVGYTAAVSSTAASATATATLGASSLVSHIKISAAPPSLDNLYGPDQTNNAVNLAAGQSVTLTAKLTVSAGATPLTVALAQNDPAGSLSASSLTFVNKQAATFVFTAGPAAGARTVTATFTPASGPAVVRTLAVNVFRVNATLTAAAPLIATNSTVALSLSLDAAPPVDTLVSLASAPANLGAVSPSSVTIKAGSTAPAPGTSITFTSSQSFSDANGNPTAGTVALTAAVAGGTTGTAQVRVSPRLTSLAFTDPTNGQAISSLGADSVTGAVLTVSLDAKAPLGGTTVFLNSAGSFNAHYKYQAYAPTSVVVPAGQSSVSLGGKGSPYAPFYACYFFSGTQPDTAEVFATLPGLAASAGGASSALLSVQPPLNGVLCPLAPFDLRQPATSPATPLVLTLTFSKGAGTVAFSTDCGTVQQGGVPVTSVTVPAASPFQTQVTFLAPASVPSSGGCTVTAQLADPSHTGGFINSQTAHVHLVAPPAPLAATHLLLNKVEYDEPGVDTGEYVEIVNPTSADVALTGYWLSLVNNNGDNFAVYPKTEKRFVDLGAGTSNGMLHPGQRLVVADVQLASTLTPGGQLQYVVPMPGPDAINNSPGAVLLIDGAGNTVDSLTYGGALFAAASPHVATGCAAGTGGSSSTPCTFDLLGGGHPLDAWVLDLVGSNSSTATTGFTNTLVRVKDGVDTGNPDLDWRVTTTATPGAANVVTGP